jgi:glyoxylase-like metal-dependent hydrolase (beta-lactamase superfamily II)
MRIFSQQVLTDGLYYIGNVGAQSFLVKGKVAALVDAGMSANGPMMLEGVREFLGDEQKLEMNLLTHSHFDHAGGTPYLKKKIPGLKVYASKVAEDVFKNPKALKLIRELNKPLEDALGNGPEVFFSDLTLDGTLKEGDVIDLGGGVTVSVLEVPGHTRCSLAYWVEPFKAIMFGEAGGVPDSDGEIIVEFLTSYKLYMESLRKMSKYNPDYICLAHGGVITGDDTRGYFEKSIKATEAFRARVEEGLKALGGDREKLLETLGEEMYSTGKIGQPKTPFMINLKAKIRAVAENL